MASDSTMRFAKVTYHGSREGALQGTFDENKKVVSHPERAAKTADSEFPSIFAAGKPHKKLFPPPSPTYIINMLKCAEETKVTGMSVTDLQLNPMVVYQDARLSTVLCPSSSVRDETPSRPKPRQIATDR